MPDEGLQLGRGVGVDGTPVGLEWLVRSPRRGLDLGRCSISRKVVSESLGRHVEVIFPLSEFLVVLVGGPDSSPIGSKDALNLLFPTRIAPEPEIQ